MKKKQYLKPQNTLYSFTAEGLIAVSNNTGGSETGGVTPGGNQGADEEGSNTIHNIWKEW